MDAFDHADTPGHLVMEDLQEQGRELGLQVAFGSFRRPDRARSPKRVEHQAHGLPQRAREFDLQLLLGEPGEHGITGWLIHRTSALSPRDGRL